MCRLFAFVIADIMFVIANLWLVIANPSLVIADILFVVANPWLVIADLIRNPVFALTGCRIESGMTTTVFPAFPKR